MCSKFQWNTQLLTWPSDLPDQNLWSSTSVVGTAGAPLPHFSHPHTTSPRSPSNTAPASPLPCKRGLAIHRYKEVSPKENQSWIFIGRADTEAEIPILWPPNAKSPLIGKDPDAGKDWVQEEKEATEDGMVEWHHQLNGHEFEQASGDSEGQASLACHHPSVGSQRVRLSDWTTATHSCPLEIMGREPPCPGASALPGPGELRASWSPALRSIQPWAILHIQSPPRPRLQSRSLPAQLPEKRAKRVPTFPCPEDEVQKGAQDVGFGRACRAEQWSAVLIPQRGYGELVTELGFDQSCFGAGGKWK